MSYYQFCALVWQNLWPGLECHWLRNLQAFLIICSIYTLWLFFWTRLLCTYCHTIQHYSARSLGSTLSVYPDFRLMESVFSIVLTRCFSTLFWLSTSAHGLHFRFVVLIGLIPSFDLFPATLFRIWITCIITVRTLMLLLDYLHCPNLCP